MTFQVVGVFCEDVREEKWGQVTIIGIMPDSVNLPAPPIDLGDRKAVPIIPKLGLYVRVHSSLDDPPPEPMKLKLLFPDGIDVEIGGFDQKLITKARDEAITKGLPTAGMVITAVLQGLQIVGPGLIRAVLQSERDTYLCGILNLVTPTLTASEPPASQSPGAA